MNEPHDSTAHRDSDLVNTAGRDECQAHLAQFQAALAETDEPPADGGDR